MLGWLSRLSVWLWLKSWFCSPWVWDPHQALFWELRASSLPQIRCLPLSPPSPARVLSKKETLKMKNHSSFRICEIPFIPDSLTSPSWCWELIWIVTNNIFDDTYVTRSECNLQGATHLLWIYCMYHWLIFPMKCALGIQMDEIMSISHIGQFPIGLLCLQLLKKLGQANVFEFHVRED